VSKLLHEKPDAFYTSFERKPGDHSVTHYCPGCGHGNVHKYVAEAIDDLGIADRVISSRRTAGLRRSPPAPNGPVPTAS
jgi:pyruvate/2-oxoacid:ferredoxin oxidoreductase beta subunit